MFGELSEPTLHFNFKTSGTRRGVNDDCRNEVADCRRITKMGDKYLRKLLIVGMTSLVRRAKHKPETIDPRLANLLARKPVRVATVAMANKTARTIWAIHDTGRDLSGRPPAGTGRMRTAIHQ